MNAEGATILLVEDSAADACYVREILPSSRYEVDHVVSLAAAVQLLSEKKFDVILLDLSLPDGSGLDSVLAMVNIAQSTPIVILSGLDDEVIAIKAVKCGAQDYILKREATESTLCRAVRYAIERKFAEEELLEAKRELEVRVEERTIQLARLNAELISAEAQARRASLLKSEFVANVSHEIRIPMNAVIGMCNVLLSTELNQHQRRYADSVKQAAHALLRIINEVLDFSKIEAGMMQLELFDFDPHELIAGVHKLLNAQAEEKNITITTSIDWRVPPCLRGDASRIRQILINLGGNALKFSNHGSISISASVERSLEEMMLVRFAVVDQGVGLTPMEQERLFQPFVQAEGSVISRSGGTGLGLSICRRLVELMGGSIGLFSSKGQGSTFWFTVPLEKRDALEPTDSNDFGQVLGQLHDGHPTRQSIKRPELILVVDDHEVNQLVAQFYLEQLGFSSHIAGNGEEAIEALARVDYALVFMDFQMPEFDGLATTRQIRKLELDQERHTPIIAMTAHAMKGDRDRCLDAGMDDYLSKPLDPLELGKVVEKWLPLTTSNQLEKRLVTAASTVVIPPIDPTMMQSRYGEFVEILIERFLEQGPIEIDNIKCAVRAGDLSSVLRYVHGFKGMCSTMLALTLRQRCLDVEAAAGPNGDTTLLTTSTDDLDREFESVKTCLEKISKNRAEVKLCQMQSS